MLIKFSESFTEHIEHLREILRRLKSHEGKLRRKKCKLFKHKVSFLASCNDCYKLLNHPILTRTERALLSDIVATIL